MNIIFEEKSNGNHIAVAEIYEEIQYLYAHLKNDLNDSEIKYYEGIKSEKRKSEWLGIRSLLMKMTGKYHEIMYTEKGNPYIVNDFHISITHSKHIIGLILSKNPAIGIDLELISPKILNTAHKFITKEEIELFEEELRLKKIYLNWCGKETLYKIKKNGGFDFKKNFRINTDQIPSSGKTDGFIMIKDSVERYELYYRFIVYKNDEILIVWH
jgi:4'-phosphopantetheinyl transferase